MRRIRLAVITTDGGNGASGGAERLFEGLVNALNFENVQTDWIPVLCDESSMETIEASYLRFWDLDLGAYDGVISTKAPSYVIRHPNHVCYLVHTMRVFYDMFEREFPDAPPFMVQNRNAIQRMDTLAFRRLSPRRRLSIGHTVRLRQQAHNQCDFQVLHPPVLKNMFRFQEANEPYAFLPGRLHRWKRVDLVIRAVRACRTPIRFLIAGTGEDEFRFRELAGGDERIQFLGRIDDADLARLYSRARVVPFTPIEEDYGYVTLEAFLSGKPVITVSDAGEPAHFVVSNKTGFVCEPNPEAISEKLDWMYEHPEEAAAMGAEAASSIRHIRWESVRAHLLAALGF